MNPFASLSALFRTRPVSTVEAESIDRQTERTELPAHLAAFLEEADRRIAAADGPALPKSF
jgi:hypothetical protein